VVKLPRQMIERKSRPRFNTEEALDSYRVPAVPYTPAGAAFVPSFYGLGESVGFLQKKIVNGVAVYQVIYYQRK